MKFNRIFLLVLDALGVGEANDAAEYGDKGANTLKHIVDNTNLFIPNLKKLGFIDTLKLNENENSEAYYTIARPNNKGKDTISGHYEIMGIENKNIFNTFPKGMPRELIDQIEARTGRRVIGNVKTLDNEIIQQLGMKHAEFGSLIIYMSLDSVINVAAHEKIIPIEKLYKYAEIIRDLTMKDQWKVAKVIALPFTGSEPGKFRITNNYKEYTIAPPTKSILDILKDNNYSVISVGKIYDVFNGAGITKKINSISNEEGVSKLLDLMDKNFTGLCFVNLNDFDTMRNQRTIKDYAEIIEAFDVEIPMILNKLKNDDLLIITADHGNDPTIKGINHTRENVPVLIYSRIFKKPNLLPILNSLADIGATIAENFDVRKTAIGNSFLNKLE